MTTDKEIELCAKALGYEILEAPLPPGVLWVQIDGHHLIWNPRTDQADSDNMACDLEIETRFSPGAVVCWRGQTRKQALHDGTIEGRRAAVREARALVAAEMGRMK